MDKISVKLAVPRSGPIGAQSRGDVIEVGPLEAGRMWRAGQIERPGGTDLKAIAAAEESAQVETASAAPAGVKKALADPAPAAPASADPAPAAPAPAEAPQGKKAGGTKAGAQVDPAPASKPAKG